jgi:uncharacterized membrane protein
LLSNLVTRKVLSIAEGFFVRVPIAKFLYSAVKDLMGAFVGEKRRFDRPVAVEVLPGSGLKLLGFVTRDSLDVWQMEDSVAVYFPQSYGFTGFLAVVPRNRVRPVAADSAQFMAFIVSGGLTGGEPLPRGAGETATTG